jgi:UDP-glucose 4-epimerase
MTNLQGICKDVDVVLHLAAMNARDCLIAPNAAHEFNAIATRNLLEAAVHGGVKRFIYLSTAHVYGTPISGVITEESPTAPVGPYATSKLAGEEAVRVAHKQGDIEGIVVRLSNSYGVPAHSQADCWMLLVNQLCRQAVSANRMILHSSGSQRRDFIPLMAACNVIAHLIRLPRSKLSNGLFNLGGGWSPTVLEMTERVGQRIRLITGRTTEILRETEDNPVMSAQLDYQMNSLLAAGVRVHSDKNVDLEIDKLIRFCIFQASENSLRIQSYQLLFLLTIGQICLDEPSNRLSVRRTRIGKSWS